MSFNKGDIIKAKVNLPTDCVFKGDQGIVVKIDLVRSVQYLTIELVKDKSLVCVNHHRNWLKIPTQV